MRKKKTTTETKTLCLWKTTGIMSLLWRWCYITKQREIPFWQCLDIFDTSNGILKVTFYVLCSIWRFNKTSKKTIEWDWKTERERERKTKKVEDKATKKKKKYANFSRVFTCYAHSQNWANVSTAIAMLELRRNWNANFSSKSFVINKLIFKYFLFIFAFDFSRHIWNFHWTTRIHRHQYASWRKSGIQMCTKWVYTY